MALSYEQQKEMSRVGLQAGQSILARTIIIFAEIIKATAQFIGTLFRQAIGK